MLSRIAVVVALVAMSPLPAFADSQREKLQVFQDIQDQVNRYGYFTIFDNVEIAIDEAGGVLLNGSVTNPYKKNQIEKRVAKVDGVTTVDNQIEVLPVSHLDDQLRYLVARAIYGHPSFGNYLRAYPPIHIVVKRGHVTLTGVVDSEVDKALAFARAGRVGAFSVTSKLRTTAEAKDELELL